MQLPISVTFVDAAGHRAKEVHAYARQFRREQVFAIFGSKTEKAPILGTPRVNKRWNTLQYELGVFGGKEALLARLEELATPGPGFIHLAPCLEDEDLHQLTAEKLVVRGDKRAFVKTRARNESTDLWVYTLAALHHLGPKVLERLGAIAAQLSTPFVDTVRRYRSSIPLSPRRRSAVAVGCFRAGCNDAASTSLVAVITVSFFPCRLMRLQPHRSRSLRRPR
ncbi:MAG: phage terminase large subunit family protein [Gemmatimonadaceae bacterium]|nr:phage terminase large subunit family protein [Gemmatimonadaceae bacterium]